jgi:hypothetical protein
MSYRILTPLIKFCISAIVSVVFLIPVSNIAIAGGNKVQSGSIQNSQVTLKNNNSSKWAKWILSQVQSLPSQQAVERGVLVASEQRNGMQQPIYNPELGGFYIDKEEQEYGVILSQTIDWFDKRSANARLGQVDFELVKLGSILLNEIKLAEALLAYIEYSMSKQLLGVSTKQETLLTKLSTDLKLREEAGDVGRVDAEMAYLSLSQNLQQISLTEIRYRKASANLQKSLNLSLS